MSEPEFTQRGGGLSVAEIAALTGALAPTGAAGQRRIVNIAALERAGPRDLTFHDERSSAADARATHAGACLTGAALAADLPTGVTALIVAEPYRAFVAAARALFPHELRPSSAYRDAGAPGTHVGAHVDPTARLEDGVVIEPGAVIGPRVAIGAGSVIAANAVIGSGVQIGRDCAIGANSTISNALLGDRVMIQPGCRIGQEGRCGPGEAGGLKLPAIGRVIIQDGVEIGAGSTIDRGAIRDTVIGEGSKIDNLVQVGHNASIGRHCIVAAQTGISGSATIEDFAVLNGRVS
jgi:UDP-3-O-[3-hydroxymyristoyl] glucosamine N-acyltransferase